MGFWRTRRVSSSSGVSVTRLSRIKSGNDFLVHLTFMNENTRFARVFIVRITSSDLHTTPGYSITRP